MKIKQFGAASVAAFLLAAPAWAGSASGTFSLGIQAPNGGFPGYAFSLVRQLNPSATTPFTLTRDDGQTIQAGFVNGITNVAPLTNFCAGHSCGYSAVPDQNGSGCVAAQSTFANMLPFTLKNTDGLPEAITTSALNAASGRYLVSASGACPALAGNTPKTMVTAISTRYPSNIGGQVGIREDTGVGISTPHGAMFEQMVCSGASWCPNLSVGVDEESGGIWYPEPSVADGIAAETYDGISGGSVFWNGTKLYTGAWSEPAATAHTMVIGGSGDLTAIGPLPDFREQILVPQDLTAQVPAIPAS